MKNNYCVIMAGGVGTRFWPMSRTNYPKQFIDILGTGHTLLQQTYNRFLSLCPQENIFVVTNETYVDLVKEQLKDIPKNNILSEPARKNTAPCIAYASYKIAELNPNAITIVAPSDHLIIKENEFVDAVKSCFEKVAQSDCLLTLGITPSRPDTGYGYIQFEESKDDLSKQHQIHKVKTFTEKPDTDMAKFFIESGDFLWNSGIFVWSTKSIIKAFETLDPEMDALFKEGIGKYNTPAETEFITKTYTECKNISIDYAIMEKANNVFVRAANIGWSDLGTWGSLYDHIPHDEEKNAIIGKNVMLYDSSKCIVNMPKNKLAVIQGLEGYIVVESDDMLLICKKDDEQQIRTFVNNVKITKGEYFV